MLVISKDQMSVDHEFKKRFRTSFAPETTVIRCTERDQTGRKCRKINEAELYPPAHNGLVAGSSPAGPTIPLFSL
jgi:hypothetical protein